MAKDTVCSGRVLAAFGVILSPAVGAILTSLSTVIVAVNARFLKIKKSVTDD